MAGELSDGLFDAPDPLTFVTGQGVVVQMAWGDEPAEFVRYCREDGFPMAKVRVCGELATVNVSRVRAA